MQASLSFFSIYLYAGFACLYCVYLLRWKLLSRAFQSTWLSPGEFTHSYAAQYFLISDRWQNNKYKRCQRRVTGTREWSKPCLRISSLLSFQAIHLEGATVNLSVASLIHCLHQRTKTLPERCQATLSWAKHKYRCHKGFMIDRSPFSSHCQSCLQLPCRSTLP